MTPPRMPRVSLMSFYARSTMISPAYRSELVSACELRKLVKDRKSRKVPGMGGITYEAFKWLSSLLA